MCPMRRDERSRLLGSPDALEAARQQIARLGRPPEDVSYQELQTPSRRVRRFLPCIFIGDVGESPSPSTGRDRPIQPWSAETGA